jgi:hypothetical protein
MADSKITALTALTAADPVNDMFPVVDVSDTSMAASGTTKRISVNNLLSSSPTASGALTVTGLVTAGSATITGDLTVDTSTLKVDSGGNAVGIGSASPTANTLTIGTSRFILCSDSQSKFGDSGIINGGAADANTQIQYFGGKSLIFSEGASNTKMTLNSSGLGLGTATFGTSAAKVLAIGTGTEPTTGPAGTVQLFTSTRSASNTIPAIFTEGSGVTNAAITNTTVTNKIAIKVNGTIYYLLATTSAA